LGVIVSQGLTRSMAKDKSEEPNGSGSAVKMEMNQWRRFEKGTHIQTARQRFERTVNLAQLGLPLLIGISLLVLYS